MNSGKRNAAEVKEGRCEMLSRFLNMFNKKTDEPRGNGAPLSRVPTSFEQQCNLMSGPHDPFYKIKSGHGRSSHVHNDTLDYNN